MTTEQLMIWIKLKDPDFTDRIQLGGVNGNAPYFLGVYPGTVNGRQHIAIGGPSCTSYDTMNARLLLRWGKSQPEAEEKAKCLWGLFYGRNDFDWFEIIGEADYGLGTCSVSCIDPGAGPVPLGKGADGVFEYVINLSITYMKGAKQ